MWPAFPPKEAGIIPVTTTTIIKHIHEYLPPTKPVMKQTAIKAVSLATGSLFLKLWITASMEGMILTRPIEDFKMMGDNDEMSEKDKKLLQDLDRQFGGNKGNLNNGGDEKQTSPMDVDFAAAQISSSMSNDSQRMNGSDDRLKDIHMNQKLKAKNLLYSTGRRYTKIVRNDLENIPITLVLAWGSLYANSNDKITTYCISIFTVSRFLHSYCYIKGLQPYRTLSYLSGMISTFIMAINLVYSVFKQDNNNKSK